MSWAVFLGAFVGSLIELVEVLAVVLVVGGVAGWRNALVGAGSAVGLVVVGARVVGRGLALVPARPRELLAGVILLAFGQAWARSATRYYSGPLESHDDDGRLQEQLARSGGRGGRDAVALATAFKSSDRARHGWRDDFFALAASTPGTRWGGVPAFEARRHHCDAWTIQRAMRPGRW